MKKVHVQLVDSGASLDSESLGLKLEGTQVQEVEETDSIKSLIRGNLLKKVEAPAQDDPGLVEKGHTQEADAPNTPTPEADAAKAKKAESGKGKSTGGRATLQG